MKLIELIKFSEVFPSPLLSFLFALEWNHRQALLHANIFFLSLLVYFLSQVACLPLLQLEITEKQISSIKTSLQTLTSHTWQKWLINFHFAWSLFFRGGGVIWILFDFVETFQSFFFRLSVVSTRHEARKRTWQ